MSILTLFLGFLTAIFWIITCLGMWSFERQGILELIIDYILKRTAMPQFIVIAGIIDALLFKTYGLDIGFDGIFLILISIALYIMYILFLVI